MGRQGLDLSRRDTTYSRPGTHGEGEMLESPKIDKWTSKLNSLRAGDAGAAL